MPSLLGYFTADVDYYQPSLLISLEKRVASGVSHQGHVTCT